MICITHGHYPQETWVALDAIKIVDNGSVALKDGRCFSLVTGQQRELVTRQLHAAAQRSYVGGMEGSECG